VNKFQELLVVKVFGAKVIEVAMLILQKFQEEMEEIDTSAGLNQEDLSSIMELSVMPRVDVKMDTVSLLSVETKTLESRSLTTLTSTLTKED